MQALQQFGLAEERNGIRDFGWNQARQCQGRRRQSSDKQQFSGIPAKFRHRDKAIFRQISSVQSIFRQEHIDFADFMWNSLENGEVSGVSRI